MVLSKKKNKPKTTPTIHTTFIEFNYRIRLKRTFPVSKPRRDLSGM